MGFDDDHGDIKGMKTQCCLSAFGSSRACSGTNKSLVHQHAASSLLGKRQSLSLQPTYRVCATAVSRCDVHMRGIINTCKMAELGCSCACHGCVPGLQVQVQVPD